MSLQQGSVQKLGVCLHALADSLIPEHLSRSLLGAVREPTPLSKLEYELAAGDPALVRGAVFDLLRTGQLRAQPLSMHTMVEAVQ